MKSDKQLPKFLETSANSKNMVIESMRLEDEGGISMQKNMIRILKNSKKQRNKMIKQMSMNKGDNSYSKLMGYNLVFLRDLCLLDT